MNPCSQCQNCMDYQLTGMLLSKDRAAVTFACAVCGKKGLSQCLMMKGEKRSQITLPLLCWDASLDKQQDLLVGWSAGRCVFSPVQF